LSSCGKNNIFEKKERKEGRKTNTIYIYIRRIIKDVEILMMEI
jgi:hypothetical protein